MELELIYLIGIICASATVLGVFALKQTGRKRRPRDTVVESWKVVSEEKDLALVAMRKELDRQRGRANRATTLLSDYETGTSEEIESNDEAKVEDVGPLLKMVLPNVKDEQIAMAMEIPQVKELMGSIGTTKNLALIKQLIPLIKKKPDETQTINTDNWA